MRAGGPRAGLAGRDPCALVNLPGPRPPAAHPHARRAVREPAGGCNSLNLLNRLPESSMSRTETDSLGPIEVPETAYWGAQTQRSLINFAIGEERMPVAVLHALALIKKAAARVNDRIGDLPPDIARLIEQAADEVLAGQHDEQFPLVVWQTGSGTQSNMNVNEVIAGRANELAGGARCGKSPVHPNDHVNRAQSSNDSFPTAMHIAAASAVLHDLLPALAELSGGLAEQSARHSQLGKTGRTHMRTEERR